MTIVQYEQPPPLPPSAPGDELDTGPRGWVARLRAAAEIAGYIGDTEFVPEALRGKPAAIAAAILFGDEVGMTPMQSLAKIAVIKGKPTLTAEAMRSLVTGAGHELWLEESTTTRCIAAGRRAGSDRVGRVTWTLDDAKRAGIASQGNWRAYPTAMLVARATAALARQMFADVIGGMPAAEELDDEPANGAPPAGELEQRPDDVAAPPAATRTRRRRAAQPAPPPAPAEPEPEPEPDLEHASAAVDAFKGELAGAADAVRTAPEPEPEPARTRPPLPPTPPVDEQTPPPTAPPATDANKRQIFALMRDVGLPGDARDARLAYTTRIIGRQLESSNDLTIGEAEQVIADLRAIRELPPEERAARLAPPDEAAVLEELRTELDATEVTPAGEHEPDATAPPVEGDERPPPVAYDEFPPGF